MAQLGDVVAQFRGCGGSMNGTWWLNFRGRGGSNLGNMMAQY